MRTLLTNVLALTLLLAAVADAQQKPEDTKKPQAKRSPPQPVKTRPVKTQPVKPEQLKAWIDDLTSRDFQVRRKASRQLVAAGTAAVEPVSKAADGNDLERTTRCLAVLKLLTTSRDSKTRQVAGDALQWLAKSKRKSVAARAGQALPKPDPSPQQLRGFRGNAVILGIAVNNGGIRISTRIVNGQRQIEVKNGTTKISINDKKGKQITIKVTEKTKGKITTKEYKAADVAELKKKFPDGYKYYQKYASGNGINLRLNRGVIQLRPRPLPGFRKRPPQRLAPAAARAMAWRQQVNAARQQLELALARLRKVAGTPGATPRELQAVLKQISSAQRALIRASVLARPAPPPIPRRPRAVAPPPAPGKPKPAPKKLKRN